MDYIYEVLKRILFVGCLSISLTGYAQKYTIHNGKVTFSQFMEGKVDTIVYKSVENKDLYLYKFQPEKTKRGGKRTAVVIIHGGGWTGGDTSTFFPHARYFASRGAVAFCVDYRLVKADEITIENAIGDCKSAIRYIRKHAEELGVDPNKIMVMGDSAGGHLSGCMGTVQGCNDFNDDLSISDAPNMAILCNPLTDFTRSSFIKVVLGGNYLKKKTCPDVATLSPETIARAKSMSPLYCVRKNRIHTLIMHGTADRVIDYAQSKDLYEAMRKVGNSCEMITLPNTNHAFVCVRWRSTETEVVKVIRQIDDYMCRYGFLKGKSKLVKSNPEAWIPKK